MFCHNDKIHLFSLFLFFVFLGDVPKNTDEDLWNDAHAMNLLFDLNTPIVSNGTTVNVIAAKLRLYKLSQVGNKQSFRNSL
jgi:hypothetical protein